MNKYLRTAALAATSTLLLALPMKAQELNFFTIGTGGTAYTYYPVGVL